MQAPHSNQAPRWRGALAGWCLGALCGAAMPAFAASTDLVGVKYDDSLRIEGQTLQLNGSGISYRAVQKVMTVGLYVPSKSSKAEDILAQRGPKVLRFYILIPTRVDELGKQIARGVELNSSKAEFLQLIPATVAMGEVFSKIRRLQPGDVLSIEWVPKRGTVFFVNNEPVGSPVGDEAFFQAVLRVWLGRSPVTQDLKDALLEFKAPPLLSALE